MERCTSKQNNAFSHGVLFVKDSRKCICPGQETCPHVVVCLDLKSRDLGESIKYIFNCRSANCGLTARCWLRAGDVQSSAEAEHRYCCSVIILTSLSSGMFSTANPENFLPVQINVVLSTTSSFSEISANI